MKLLLIIFLLLAMILGFLYLCKKMGIDVNNVLTGLFDSSAPAQPQVQPQNLVAYQQELYQICESEYEHFAICVRDCLVSIARKCHLNFDKTCDKSEIYCANTGNRVKQYGNSLTFTYEVGVHCRSYIQGGKLVCEKIDTNMIAGIIRGNFPAYLNGGYICTGSIIVWDNGNGSISIEFNGVNRNTPMSINTRNIII